VSTVARRGTWFVVATPFLEDASLDRPSQHRLVEAAVTWGVDGLTAMGVTSEATALTPSERSTSVRCILDAAGGRVPVVVGCSAGSSTAVVELIREARELGAAGAMVAPPPGFSDLDALPSFFGRVAEAGLPILVQDEPAATGVVLPVDVLVRCLEASGSATVKLEDPPTPPKIAMLRAARPGLDVFGGLGGAWALSELRSGACGTMTGFAFPEVLRAVRVAHEAGDAATADRIFDRYLPLIQFEAQPGTGLSIRKELLRRRGVIASAAARVARRLGPRTMAEIDDVLRRVGVEPGPTRLEVG
jgi:4-hydroxy-tetrahydrodipicolinate synthase